MHLLNFIVFDFSVYTGLGLIIDPFSDEELVFIMVEIAALAFSHVVDPVALKVVTVSLGEDTIAVPLALVPLALVDVLVSIDHSALPLWHAGDPVAIVAVGVLVEESASAVLLVFEPVPCVFTTELPCLIPPIGPLAVALVSLPKALILISILVEVNTESVFLVIFPVSDVSGSMLPFLALDASILLSLLLLDPENGSVSTILLSLGVAHLPKLVGACLLQRVLHLGPSIQGVSSSDARSVS
jgi:hypothetical protein